MIPLRAVALALAAALAASCVAQQPTPAPTVTPTTFVRHTAIPTPLPSPTPTASPTPDPVAADILEFLARRDAAHRSGDPQEVLELIAQRAPAELRERELALARIAAARMVPAPERTLVGYVEARDDPLGLMVGTVVEADDQGRTRPVRYFFQIPRTTLLTEPTIEQLGPLQTRAGTGFEIRFREIDRPQTEATERIAEDALRSLVARLGEAYAPHRPFTITLQPVTVAGLPAVASGLVEGNEITLLSSQSMIVEGGPGGEWSRRVVAHEIAHVLLAPRGRSPWLLVEGIPLWLTDDRRQPEMDRLVASGALWDLAHLLEGPRSVEEFFAAYAQASSFVRYLATTYGDRAVLAAWEAGRRGDAETAFRTAFGVTASEAHAAWLRSIVPLQGAEMPFLGTLRRAA